MERLSGMDAFFLYIESPTQHMHVTLCAVLDAADMPGGYSFETVRDHIASRVHLVPPFSRRLVPVPLNIHHPLWVEDPAFEVEAHIRRASAAAPGSDKELARITAEIAGIPLDRARPLWEMWVIDGLADDRFAIVAKLHHSTLDGVAGVEQMVNFFDFDAAGELVDRPEATERAIDHIPSDLELITYATVSRILGVREIVPLIGRTAGSIVTIARHRFDQGHPPTDGADKADEADDRFDNDGAHADVTNGNGTNDTRTTDHDDGTDERAENERAEDERAEDVRTGGTPLIAPRTRLNGTIVAGRRVGFASIPLDGVKQIRQVVDGATVNDVILAVCAGALRRYLLAKGELPEQPLVAACPINVRSEEQQGLADNRISAMFVELPCEIADPLERLAATHEGSQASKNEHSMFGSDMLQRWAEVADPNLFNFLSERYANSGLADRHRPAINVMISNVPGPPFPLFLAGSRLVRAYPMGQIMEGVGLNITVMSYCGSIDFGFMAAANLLPDIDELAAQVAPAYDELAALASDLASV